MNYKQWYLFGLCSFQQLDSCVDVWHKAPENGISLAEYLGLSKEEYAIFMTQGAQALEEVLERQRRHQRFRIYQLDFSDGKTKTFAYMGLKGLHKAGYKQPPASEYCKVFDAEIICPIRQTDEEILERLFERYNDALPKEYPGRSLSPSDVVELYDEESRRYFYRDVTAFAAVKFSPFLARPFEKSLWQEMVTIDREMQFQSVLSQCKKLGAELCVNHEHRYFTIGTRPTWNNPVGRKKAKELQNQVRRLSEQSPNVVYYCFDEDNALIYVI